LALSVTFLSSTAAAFTMIFLGGKMLPLTNPASHPPFATCRQ